jgi:hypothetical protein
MKNLIIHFDFQDKKAAIEHAIMSFETDHGNLLKSDRNSIKSMEVEGLNLNFKKFKTPHLFNGFIYKYIRPSKAKRSYEYANVLLQKSIQTPTPIAYFEATNFFGLKESYYISLQIDYDLDFRVLIHDLNYPNRDEILKQFTIFTFSLHEAGINFLDHSPGNTLIVKAKENQYEFYLIDLNRMRFETLNFNQRMHNIRRLWPSKYMVKIMAKTYASLVGKSFEDTHAIMLKHSRAFQKKVNSKKLRKRRQKLQFKKV